MTRPNLFIVGAPKCGTTSLCAWLADHPKIFMPKVKEPHFFNFDFANRRYTDFAEYERLFDNASESNPVVAEGSVRYLYSRTAIPAILRYSPEARFIVMIRSPLEMAPSLHANNIFNGHEDQVNFETAWRCQEERYFGRHVPRQCLDPQLLWYGPLCKLGRQLASMFKYVPRERVLVVDLFNLRNEPAETYQSVLKFLAIEHDGRVTFPAMNQAKRRKYRSAWRLLEKGNLAYRALGLPSVRLGLTEMLNRHGRVAHARAPLPKRLQMELADYFREDIELTEAILQTPLPHFRVF